MLQTLSSLQDAQKMYDWFTQMRATQPVWLDEESGCWHVFRYEDVLRISTDYTTFSSERRPQDSRRFNTRSSQAPSLLAMDPPQHRQYRNLVSPSFTSRALAPLSRRIQAIVQELLDQVRPKGSMDFIADLAYPLPTTVIAELLGIPTSDRPMFKRWADALLSRQLSDADLFHTEMDELEQREDFQRAKQATQEMEAYFERMLDERRREPREDLMSELLAAEVEGARLTGDELLSFCILLLIAGHVTTTNLLAHAILCLDAHPDAMEQLRADPELTASAIEEVLRYASPVWRLTRRTKSAVEVAGTTIPADAVVFAWLASANRDEEQFPDPTRFDIARSPNKHVAFGHGIHFCVGAPLARLEAGIALPMLLAQLPNLQRASSAPLELLAGRFLFGVKRLPVTFTASSPVLQS